MLLRTSWARETDTEHLLASLHLHRHCRTCLSLRGVGYPWTCPSASLPSYSLSPARYAEARVWPGRPRASHGHCLRVCAGDVAVRALSSFYVLPGMLWRQVGAEKLLWRLSVHRSHLPQAGVSAGLSDCEHQHVPQRTPCLQPRGRPKGPLAE